MITRRAIVTSQFHRLGSRSSKRGTNEFHIGVEASVSLGWTNLAAEVKGLFGFEARVDAKELVRANVSTSYPPDARTGRVTKLGVYVLPLAGFGSTYSTHSTIDRVEQSQTTESYSIGIAGLGMQFNFNSKSDLVDVRYGLDSGVSLAAFLGVEINIQIGGIYKLN